MIQFMASQPQVQIQLTMGQALIWEPLEASISIPKKWWVALHDGIIWYMWIACNEEMRQNKRVLESTTKNKIRQ